MKIVFDSSTLILVAKITLIRTIANKFNCVITEEVKKESMKKEELTDAKLILQIIKDKKIQVVKIISKNEIEYEFRLGPGESSVLKLATDRNLVVATDDKSTIKACKIFNIKFATAIDFVIRAFEKNEISKEEAIVKINKLNEYGRYDTKIIDAALKIVGDKDE